MKKISTLISGLILAAGLSMNPLQAQDDTAKTEKNNITIGYNALQTTVQNSGEHLVRMYNDATLNLPGGFGLNAKIMNQTESTYTVGWETFTLDKKGIPLAPLYILRAGGSEIKNMEPVAHGLGVRLTLDKFLPEAMFGFIDVVGWTDPQEDWVGNAEAALYIGKGNVGAYIVFRPEGNNFGEIEAVSKSYSTKFGDFSLIGRIESINFNLETSRAVVGINYTP